MKTTMRRVWRRYSCTVHLLDNVSLPTFDAIFDDYETQLRVDLLNLLRRENIARLSHRFRGIIIIGISSLICLSHSVGQNIYASFAAYLTEAFDRSPAIREALVKDMQSASEYFKNFSPDQASVKARCWAFPLSCSFLGRGLEWLSAFELGISLRSHTLLSDRICSFLYALNWNRPLKEWLRSGDTSAGQFAALAQWCAIQHEWLGFVIFSHILVKLTYSDFPTTVIPIPENKSFSDFLTLLTKLVSQVFFSHVFFYRLSYSRILFWRLGVLVFTIATMYAF